MASIKEVHQNGILNIGCRYPLLLPGHLGSEFRLGILLLVGR